MRIMGIDYGKKRVGIAISDEDKRIAFPTTVIENGKDLVSEVSELCVQNKVGEIVVGESKNHSGADNPIMKDINNFVEDLKIKTEKPIYMEPEFFTSVQAKRLQGENKMHDASAAAIILQSHLDKHKDDNLGIDPHSEDNN
ncbi:MAG: hypothetical protein COV70_00215 [Parcubacteria group bacterium CG11_big_fil_rev_8_21_14_0_20_39_22]|nr:MAG: hypothetical protein COV70_00215 [Parcubacteria group bacterium CG11_big_fil_rev_8_21_14_0_20_39_22]